MAGLIACWASAIVLAAFSASASADSSTYTLTVHNEFGQQLSDVGRTRITVNPPTGALGTTHFGCDASLAQIGNQIAMTTSVHPGPPTSRDYCDEVGQAFIGPLNPGVYQVNALAISESSATLANLSSSFTITARGAKCNVNPFLNQLTAEPNLPVDYFHMQFETNPDYRAKFGDVSYAGSLIIGNIASYVFFAFPPLQDPVRELAHLQQTGEFKSEFEGANLCLTTPPPDGIDTVVEYHNTVLDHYFMTPNRGEQAAIEAGKVGVGWVRTDNNFRVVVSPACPSAVEGAFHPVYRFAGIPNVGPNSHFFTVSQDECAVVRDRVEWHWQFEGAPFWATEPSQGVCPPGTKTLYRAYNNGKGGTPNHRYSTDIAIIASMVDQGWVSEGVTMCVLQ